VKRKICFITTAPATLVAFLQQHIVTLAEEHDVTVVTDLSGTKLALPDNIAQKDISIPRQISIISDLKALVKLIFFMSGAGFDAVISVTPKAGLLSMLSALFCRVPVRLHWFTGQVWATRTGFMRKLLKACDLITAISASHLLADSDTQRQFMLAEGIACASKLKIIHKGSISGVNLSRFAINQDTRTNVRSTLGISDKTLLFLFLGRLNRDKGVSELVEAFSSLAEELPNIRLAIVGPDEENLMSELEILAKQQLSKIYFKGFTDKPENFFAAADVFVLPSHREGFGTSVIEAAALGVPCIGSRIYGLEDAIYDGVTGVLFPCGNVVDLKTAMQEMALSDAVRLQMGEAAKQRVEKDFDAVVITREFINYLRSIGL
jgi:glycosyltransferase involved in cell wall biosynthesis